MIWDALNIGAKKLNTNGALDNAATVTLFKNIPKKEDGLKKTHRPHAAKAAELTSRN